jgi:hypothetical protein
LTRIETEAFAGALLYLVIVPGNTSFIAGDAFPSHCAVRSAWPDSDARLCQWNLRRRSRSSDAFKQEPWGKGESSGKAPRYD